MRRNWLAAAAALVLIAPAAQADEIGGSGFAVPQDEWLWGIEGLVRTPVDLSANFGGAWYGYEAEGKLTYFDDAASRTREKDIDYKHADSIQGGFRIAGGIGYWNCCVLIEPAMGFWGTKPIDGDRKSAGPTVTEPGGGDEIIRSETKIEQSIDVGFGPQMTWLIKDDTPLLASLGMSGLPLVFFPFIGFSDVDYEAQFTAFDTSPGTTRLGGSNRNFEETLFLVGFDLDFPLPGAKGPFTHALTFGFKWVDSGEKHDIGLDLTPWPGESQAFAYSGTEGYRVELRYQVTWNDFEGFVKRHIFGPVN